jgi:hypothetical protein
VKTQIWIAITVYVMVAIVKKTAEAGLEPLHNSTDLEYDTFRKNAHFGGCFNHSTRKIGELILQPVDFIRLTLGHYWKKEYTKIN